MVAELSGEGEAVQASDAEHGVVNAVTFKRQSRRIFQVFMRAKTCSTRARTLLCERLCSSFQATSSSSLRVRRWGMTRPVPR